MSNLKCNTLVYVKIALCADRTSISTTERFDTLTENFLESQIHIENFNFRFCKYNSKNFYHLNASIFEYSTILTSYYSKILYISIELIKFYICGFT